MYEKKKVLITVKTYPVPSDKYLELVCTAGVLADGSFIRLYPVDFRYRPYWQWYKKYQWIEVEVEKNTQDRRMESYRPRLDSIRVLGSPLSTKNKWAERKKYVLGKKTCSLEILKTRRKERNVSLGIVRPKVVNDLIIERTDTDWSPKQKEVMKQGLLFGPRRKPLEKIPFRFVYDFQCDDVNCNGHKISIVDWEVGALYLRMKEKYKDERIAAEKVRDSFYNQICAEDVDTHFFVGTNLSYGTWMILGAFYPKK